MNITTGKITIGMWVLKYFTSNLRSISGCIRTIEFNQNEMNNQTKQTPKQNKTKPNEAVFLIVNCKYDNAQNG